PVPLEAADVGGNTGRDDGRVGGAIADAGRYADGQRARRYLRTVEHDRVRTDDRSAVHHDAVQHDGAGADEAPGLDPAALEVDEMADHAVVADSSGMHAGGVHDRAVLHRGARADRDAVAVAAEHGRGPHGGFGAEVDGADD